LRNHRIFQVLGAGEKSSGNGEEVEESDVKLSEKRHSAFTKGKISMRRVTVLRSMASKIFVVSIFSLHLKPSRSGEVQKELVGRRKGRQRRGRRGEASELLEPPLVLGLVSVISSQSSPRN
jgi:hypothetical protein